MLAVLLTASLSVAANSPLEITITTEKEEAVSFNFDWYPDGHADWVMVGETDEDGNDLIYHEYRTITHFYGRPGQKEIIFKPNRLDQISRITWTGQDLVGNIPQELTELERFRRLNLENNRLGEGEELPDYLEDFSELSYLELGKNRFSGEIPPQIAISTLNVLSLHNNRFSGAVPEEIGDIHDLERLYLHNNQLESFPDLDPNDDHPERTLSSLKVLTLKNNLLTSLPKELLGFENLNTLSLRNNKLTKIFEPLEGDENEINMTTLEYLDTYNNLIGCEGYELPNEMDFPAMIELSSYHNRQTWPARRPTIDMRYNCLSHLPEEFFSFSALGELKFDGNVLEGFSFLDDDENQAFSSTDPDVDLALPSTIGRLEDESNRIGFTLFSAYNNLISGALPPEMGELTRLETLRLQNNKLTDPIPEELLDLDELRFLSLENNLLEMPDEENGEISATAENLRHLYLGRNEIENIPAGLRVPIVRFAHLEENIIEELPEDFGSNFGDSLQELTLNKNQLTELPNSFGNLDTPGAAETEYLLGVDDLDLTFLDLGTNLLESFPGDEDNGQVTDLVNLRYLNLSRQSGQAGGRGIMEGPIPEEIGNLNDFEIFLIHNNLLERLPEDGWDGLSNLIYFYAQSNLLENLPPSMGQLSSLERLYLNNNRIADPIPDELTETGSLLRAYLQYNEIVGPLPENDSWQQLERFFADDNNITGGIREEFVENLPSVEYFSIYRNNLDGSIDSKIENMRSLRWWDVALNNPGLTGAIPTTIESLQNLELFDFNNNRITSVPDEINNLPGLITILGFENRLTSFASDIGNMAALEYFDFHDGDRGQNRVPQFPDNVDNLTNLIYFSFGENRVMSGTVPFEDWIGNYPEDALFLNNNDLSGAMTDGMLTETSDMVFFNLRDNNFNGNFPQN